MATSTHEMSETTTNSNTLCSVCDSLHITLDKFIINDDPNLIHDNIAICHAAPGGLLPTHRIILKDSYDPSGLQTVELGFLDEIYRKHGCPFCRLVFEATRGETGTGTVEGIGIGVDGLSAEGKRVGCWMEWQLDARVEEVAATTTTTTTGAGNNHMTAKTRRIRIFSSNHEFPDTYLSLFEEDGGGGAAAAIGSSSSSPSSSYLGRPIPDIINVALIQHWLRTCETHHTQCRIPTHFLHRIGPSSCFRVIDVKTLAIVEASLETIRFVALSYLWGSVRNQAALMKSNFFQFSQPGALRRVKGRDVVPGTIRDAIELTRELGESYLWVDALCIIQDDVDDKIANIEAMDLVYGRAVLTICAAAGFNSNAGLAGYRPQSREIYQPIETVAGLQLIVLRPVETYIQQSQWVSRGWTFQERQLSKRCLLLTNNRMFYQCQQSVWSEETSSESGSSRSWTLDHIGSPTALFSDNPLKRYSNSVELFTARQLSYEQDVIKAFAGILTSLEQPLGTTFLWALPVAYFDWALLWEPKEKSRRLEGFPSWSWCGWTQQSGWNLSTVSGVLTHLHEWITDHTWIIWCKGRTPLERELLLKSKIAQEQAPSQEFLSERWRGYDVPDMISQTCDVYGRPLSKDPTKSREQEKSWQLREQEQQEEKEKEENDENPSIPEKEKYMTAFPPPDACYLHFWTYSAHFVLTRDTMSSSSFKSSLDASLHRFGIQDVRGDWCGTIVLDTTWFTRVGGIFEFLALSEAKDFSLEEYDSWSFYVPKERAQSEWDLYYALLVVDVGGSGCKERVGLAKIYQQAFRASCVGGGGCEWKFVTLA